MVTIAELLEWRPGTLDSLSEYLYDKLTILTRLPDEIHDAQPPESWTGLGVVFAWANFNSSRTRLNDLAAQLSDLAVTVKETGKETREAQKDLHNVLQAASGDGYSVNHHTGEVTPPPISIEADTKIKDAEARRLDTIARSGAARKEQSARTEEIVEDIDAALKRAERADTGLALAMSKTTKDETRGGTGSIQAATASQLPPSLDNTSPAELAKKLGSEIGLATIKGYLEGEMPLHRFFKAEYGVTADYKVMMDGTVKMSLHLEGGIGAALIGSGAEASIMAGRTGEAEISFKSEEAAQRFLDGFDDAATDFDLSTIRTGGGLSGSMAKNIAEYIRTQEVTSLKTGIYGKGEFEFDTAFAKGDANGRIDAYRDFDQQEYGFKVQGSLSGTHVPSGTGGAVSLSGELKTDLNGTPKELSLSGEISGRVAAEELGIDIPGARGGTGADVELKVDRDNVMWDEIQEAAKRGDMDRATDLAMDHGQVIVRQTSVGGSDFDAKRPEGGLEWGTESTTTNNVWVRDANSSEVVSIDPKTGAATSLSGR